MADIFNEIDEELRQEKIHKLWDRYGVLVLVLAVAVVAAVAGWRFYDHWRVQQSEAQGAAFAAATALVGAGDLVGAEQAFAKLSGQSTGGYPALSALRAAALKAENGDAPGALAAFDAVARAATTPPLLADLARIRAAGVAVDVEDRATLEARVAPLAAAGRPFRGEARELLALAAWKAGDTVNATKWIGDIEADPETPRDLAERSAMLSSLIKAQAPSGKVN